jgi:hypothetical protein
MNRCGNSTNHTNGAASLTQYCNGKTSQKFIEYNKIKTSTNDPTISKKMAYSQLVNSSRTTIVTGATYTTILANSKRGVVSNNNIC